MGCNIFLFARESFHPRWHIVSNYILPVFIRCFLRLLSPLLLGVPFGCGETLYFDELAFQIRHFEYAPFIIFIPREWGSNWGKLIEYTNSWLKKKDLFPDIVIKNYLSRENALDRAFVLVSRLTATATTEDTLQAYTCMNNWNSLEHDFAIT